MAACADVMPVSVRIACIGTCAHQCLKRVPVRVCCRCLPYLLALAVPIGGLAG
jgi:hypothetical protein